MRTKHIEQKLNGNCSKMLRAIQNIFWQQQPTKQHWHGHLLPNKTTKACGKLLDKQRRIHYWHLPMDHFVCIASRGRPTRTYDNSSLWIQDVIWKICWKRWMIETHGKIELGKSMLVTRLDDDITLTYAKIFIKLTSHSSCLSQLHEYIFIYSRLTLLKEIAIGFHHCLQMTLEISTHLSLGLLILICKCCHYPCLQFVFDVARSFAVPSRDCAPHILIKGISIWGVRRPDVGVMWLQKFSDSKYRVLILVLASSRILMPDVRFPVCNILIKVVITFSKH